MAELVGICVAAGFVIVGAVGVIDSNKAFRLFKGDIMERLFKFMAAGFLVIVAAALTYGALLIAGQSVPADVLGLALMAPVAVFLVGLICLIDWNERSKLNHLS
jgi:hypothetical protein